MIFFSHPRQKGKIVAITCPQCQFENPNDTVFCGTCGTKLSLSEEDSHSLTMKILRFVKGLKQNCKLFGGKQNLIFLIIQNK
ncbi:MAG TPA: hypothetical protein ENI27_05280 [bacterium]|nr:hypothetical protein [bacterium]